MPFSNPYSTLKYSSTVNPLSLTVRLKTLQPRPVSTAEGRLDILHGSGGERQLGYCGPLVDNPFFCYWAQVWPDPKPPNAKPNTLNSKP